MTGLDALLDALPQWTLVGGKGGVGKTTCASALALRSAARGTRTLLVATDPARTLGDALEHALGPEPMPVPGRDRLHACQLDAGAARAAFLARWREIIVTIVDRGTYLDREDVEGLVDAAMPGADEVMALLALGDIGRDASWERVFVDTAPTGHTLRLLALPDTFRALVGLLGAMQDKHRFMVSALTHRYRPDAADAFLAEMQENLDRLRGMLTDPRRSAAVLVTRPEPLVTAETARYAAALKGLGIRVAAVVVNAWRAGADARDETLRGLAEVAPAVPRFRVPFREAQPLGIGTLERWGEALTAWEEGEAQSGAGAGGPPQQQDTPAPRRGRHPSPANLIEIRPLTIVGGKGGVGKTTAACAMAIAEAAADRPLLLISTDPAPSIADALDQVVGDEDTPVEGAPGLTARQMDAAAAFDRMRRSYESRIDRVFEGLMGRNLDASHDRRILRELLSLAPPGIDEVYALALLGETLAEGRFAAVIIDPAPTGHLLRLLEMPALALEWSHRLMRLMLKYREVGGLGDTAEEVLAFARRTRAVGELLADASRAAVVVVALDEPLVRAETVRLIAAVRSLHIEVAAILWNRTEGAPRALPTDPPTDQFVAAALEPAPRGVVALRQWHARWSPLASSHG